MLNHINIEFDSSRPIGRSQISIIVRLILVMDDSEKSPL